MAAVESIRQIEPFARVEATEPRVDLDATRPILLRLPLPKGLVLLLRRGVRAELGLGDGLLHLARHE